ncbi:MAG TPA: hypothetical protein VE826_01150 [Dongiaceae bacterium]|nr:hypothetical protein [Dongiaceae bacterium]
MLTVQISTLLALLGTVLMAVVIFAPAPAPAKVTTSFAPPFAPPPPPLERWAPDADPFAVPSAEAYADWTAALRNAAPATEPEPPAYPAWPARLHASAACCDAQSRLELVAALSAIRTAWSNEVLRRALEDEPDRIVRDAIGAALAS